MPWIWLEKHFLWFTKGDILLKYRRNSKTGYICGHQSIKVCTKHEDICRFVIKNDLIISGGRKGSIDVWDKYKGKVVVTQNKAHSCDVNSVDSTLNNVVISGSKDTYVKLWSLHNNGLKCLKTISVKDRIWTLAVNDIKQQFIVGSAGCGPNKSLLLYDIEG
jgi:WD40 repeat protein